MMGKSTGKETVKTHLCTMGYRSDNLDKDFFYRRFLSKNEQINVLGESKDTKRITNCLTVNITMYLLLKNLLKITFSFVWL